MRQREREIEFNVNAYTARLIGRENVSKLEGAILEIVKNAYDADAKVICLYYSNAKDMLYIMDNGVGMTEEVIRNHWMTIGNSSKKESYTTKEKRIQTGAKGIGRFALDRIADKCNMLTISDEGGIEWIVDWNEFNGKKNISDVKAKLYDSDEKLLEYVGTSQWNNEEMAQYMETLEFNGKGTAFCLSGLHDIWDVKTMQKLHNHFETLLPPDVVKDFKIFLFDDTTDKEDAEIVSANLDSYDYKIEFNLCEEVLTIELFRNEFDFGEKEKQIFAEIGFSQEEQQYFHGKKKKIETSLQKIKEKGNYIGNIDGTLYFNKISADKEDTEKFFYKSIVGRKNYTKEFGGIKIYRDHFRVRPYGEYGDNDFDWLELSGRRNKSPAGLGHPTGKWRVGAEQIIGIVNISRENSNLEDAANRNGIQEGKGFAQLKNIILNVILEFERDRQSVGRVLAQYKKDQDAIEAEKERLRLLAEQRQRWEEEQRRKQQQIQNNEEDEGVIDASSQGKIEADRKMEASAPVVNPTEVVELIESMEEKQEQELQELRDENKMLQTLATTGIITNMFMHEIRTLTNNIGQELDAAYEAIKYDKDFDYAFENIKQAITFKKHFASWFGVTIESIRKDKRKRKTNNIKEMLTLFIQTWKSILGRTGVSLIFECDEDIEFRCFEFDIENIISNLFSNSLKSFDREMDSILEKREIKLNIQGKEEGFILCYEDSGWGLIPRFKERPDLILEPFECENTVDGEEEGTGMGMWIVNKTVLEYNGKIDLSENKVLKKGFKIRMSLGGEYV